MHEIKLDDSQLEFVFPFAGLEFQANTFFQSRSGNISKLASSRGPLVSDFVTHQSDFKYDAYGIHVGQDDRLTFFGPRQEIIGYFIDCRDNSPTFGERIVARYNASMERRLVIPRGVAHSFDNLQGIVTRDEPVWYSDFHNPDWDINNDLISLKREISFSGLPRVRPNNYLLPDEAHHLFSRIQQELLVEARRYAKREKVESNSSQYLVVENSSWNDVASDYERLLTLGFDISGLGFGKNNFALTGSRSYTIVPSTESCVADIIEYTPSTERNFWLHYRQRLLLTFLAPESTDVLVEVCDLRREPQQRRVERISFTCEPRIHLVIPQGVAYRILGKETYCIRFEPEMFVDFNEPRSDIPLLGRDTVELELQQLRTYSLQPIPSIKCPKSALHLLAREEINNHMASQNFRSGKS